MAPREAAPTAALLLLAPLGAAALALGCSDDAAGDEPDNGAEPSNAQQAANAAAAANPATPAPSELDAIEKDFPLHGLVTAVQLSLHAEPDPDAQTLGWVRTGARLHLAPEPETTSTCATGWYRVHPRGWVCAGKGVDVDDEPPRADVALPPPRANAPLPYDYYFVTAPMTPEYHRKPSRNEQRLAQAFADRYLELREESERRAERMRAGELPGEPSKPAVVRRYLERGFYVAGGGVEVRAFRRFVRTVWGSYVKESNMEKRTGGDFQGVELGDDRQLPLAFALRTAHPLKMRETGEDEHRFDKDEEAEPFERQAILDGWKERTRIGDRIYHALEGERYLRSWYAGVAEKMEPPFELTADDEPWVHVDLGEQTLVLYRGKEPVFATLVSTGIEEHETPTGTFEVHKKRITDTMADLGPDAGDDRYRIEDVPWVQYFEGSIALHGAFWHNRFGLTRSHGCVNISPRDAQHVFNETWPKIPPGWQGVNADKTGFATSHVVVTE